MEASDAKVSSKRRRLEAGVLARASTSGLHTRTDLGTTSPVEAVQGLVAGAEQKAGRGRSVQEKRTCPECGQQVGPRFGTGKGGEGSQCPGLNPSGTRCHYVFGEGQKKQVQKRLVEQCSQKPHGPLSEVKAAYAKAYKKVVSEAAKTGASAVLLWYNPVQEDVGASKELNNMIRRTNKAQPERPSVPAGEYAFRVSGVPGGLPKCCVVMQGGSGTSTAQKVLEAVALPTNTTAVKFLQKLADKESLEHMAANSIQITNQSEPDQGAGSVLELHELETFLKRINLYETCYPLLAQNGLTVAVMRAIIKASNEMHPFVESLKVVGLPAGQAMVIFANLSSQ